MMLGQHNQYPFRSTLYFAPSALQIFMNTTQGAALGYCISRLWRWELSPASESVGITFNLLRDLRGLCVSVVDLPGKTLTTETQRTLRKALALGYVIERFQRSG